MVPRIEGEFAIKHRGIESAVRALQEAPMQPDYVFYRVDIANCFDCVRHDAIMRGFDRMYKGGWLRSFFEKTLKWGRRQYGIPQGSPLSPLLLELALLAVDEQVLHAQGASRVTYVRYVDDILFVGPQHEVQYAVTVLERALVATGHEINPDKTYSGPVANSVDFLGYELRYNPQMSRMEVAIGRRSKERLQQTCRRIDADEGLSALQKQSMLHAVLSAWISSYKRIDPFAHYHAYIELYGLDLPNGMPQLLNPPPCP